MALTSEVLVGSRVDVPDGYTYPVPALSLTTPQVETVIVTSVASTSDNVDPIVGLNALLAEIKIEVDGTTLPGYGLDLAGNTVDAQYTLQSCRRDHGASIYSDTDNFIATVKVAWTSS